MSKLLDLWDSLTGVVLDYSLSNAPDGWMLCYGQALTPDNAATDRLRAKLIASGSPYGVSGADPKLPDARGRLTAGCDAMGGTSALRITSAVSGIDAAVVGATGGDQKMHGHGHDGSGTAASAGAHTHTVSGTAASAGAHTHTVNTANYSDDGSAAGTQVTQGPNNGTPFGINSSGAHTHTVSGSAESNGAHTHTITLSVTDTGEGASQNMPPTLVFNKIIKL